MTIINADASQVYRDLRIVSARPSLEEEAKAPHCLFGTVDGAEACSAATWAGMAKVAITEAHHEGRLPVLVGGTGLYLRTLIDGIAPVPEIDPMVRAQVRALPVHDAYSALCSEDPAAAVKLSANDSARIARALEVVRSTGRTLTDWKQSCVGGINHDVTVTGMILLPPREWLFERCDARFEWMLENGGLAEVQALLDRQLDPALPVMRAIGVREITAMLNCPHDKNMLTAKAQITTHQYAKRQYTWFRNQPPVEWEQIGTQLNADNITDLAIICRDRALTG